MSVIADAVVSGVRPLKHRRARRLLDGTEEQSERTRNNLDDLSILSSAYEG